MIPSQRRAHLFLRLEPMPTNRIAMRRIRETLHLHLHLQAGLSLGAVARALKISERAVGNFVSLARVVGVDLEMAQTLSWLKP